MEHHSCRADRRGQRDGNQLEQLAVRRRDTLWYVFANFLNVLCSFQAEVVDKPATDAPGGHESALANVSSILRENGKLTGVDVAPFTIIYTVRDG